MNGANAAAMSAHTIRLWDLWSAGPLCSSAVSTAPWPGGRTAPDPV